jgi:hypothetical protein
MHPQKLTRSEEGTGHQAGASRKGASKGNGLATKKSGRRAVPTGNGHGSASQSIPKAPASGFNKSLRANLETLQSMDCNCIVQVRKINRLGFESARALEEHFSKYGKVDRVLVSHCYAKARNLRFRPSGLGFVVMSCGEQVQAILADGPEHRIIREIDGTRSDVAIHCQAFKPQRALAEAEEGYD